MTRPPFPALAWRRAALALCLGLGLASLVASCGGGGGGDVGTGGTGAPATYSSGRVSGFGSVIVNGVHYDDSTATIVDDDGGLHTPDDLALGMTVRIDAGEIADDSAGVPRATAKTVRFGDDLAGPITSIDLAGNTLTMLDQVVTVDLATVFSGTTTGLAGLQAGDLVQVFAFLDDTTGRFKATRIQKQATLAAWTLQGPVSSPDAANHRFSIGGAVIDDSGVSNLPSLSDGLLVRVTLQASLSGGRYVATAVKAVQAHTASKDEHTEVEGLVGAFVSLSNFQVDGVRVNAGGPGVVFENGTSAAVVNGARVEVEGTTVNGVLVATKVDVRQDDEQESEVELSGSLTAVDTGAQTFVLRGQTVAWTAETVFTGGTAAKLVVGAKVEMHGHLAAGGGSVIADTIAFDD